MAPLWLSGLGLLLSPGQILQRSDALIGADGRLQAFGPAAVQQALGLGLEPRPAPGCWLAPALVDPHSVLEDPFQGRAECLASLAEAAAAGGYGTVALLPWASPWRDRPESLQIHWAAPLRLRLWGSFSQSGLDQGLAAHADQLAAGAVGLAGGAALPPAELLERALTLAEWAERPLLLAPRLAQLSGGGFVRESVETLRAGWPPDPTVSELLPLELLRSLVSQRPQPALALMNLSTAAGVQALRQWPLEHRPAASVSWWHLLADAGALAPSDSGWRVEPSLGGPQDREALIAALGEGLIAAVAVHHLPLDREEQLLPLDQRRAGVAGHGGPVLPLLWQELVERRGWSVEQLWQALSWGPAALLGLEPEGLEPGSQRWLLFDPHHSWRFEASASPSRAANQPWLGRPLSGRILASGLTAPGRWLL
jgi:dihydroorotase